MNADSLHLPLVNVVLDEQTAVHENGPWNGMHFSEMISMGHDGEAEEATVTDSEESKEADVVIDVDLSSVFDGTIVSVCEAFDHQKQLHVRLDENKIDNAAAKACMQNMLGVCVRCGMEN